MRGWYDLGKLVGRITVFREYCDHPSLLVGPHELEDLHYEIQDALTKMGIEGDFLEDLRIEEYEYYIFQQIKAPNTVTKQQLFLLGENVEKLEIVLNNVPIRESKKEIRTHIKDSIHALELNGNNLSIPYKKYNEESFRRIDRVILHEPRFTETENNQTKSKISNKVKPDCREKVFISHSSKDAKYAEMLKDFLVRTGVPNESIFCSSLPGNQTKTNFPKEVHQSIKESIITIILLSENYYNSAYCLNEEGIAWYLYLTEGITPIVIGLPSINRDHMRGFINKEYIMYRMDNPIDLSRIIQTVSENTVCRRTTQPTITGEIIKTIEEYSSYNNMEETMKMN